MRKEKDKIKNSGENSGDLIDKWYRKVGEIADVSNELNQITDEMIAEMDRIVQKVSDEGEEIAKNTHSAYDELEEFIAEFNREQANNEKLLKNTKIIEKAMKNPKFLKRCPSTVRNNKMIIAEVMEYNPEAYRYASLNVLFDSEMMGYAQELCNLPELVWCDSFASDSKKLKEFKAFVDRLFEIREEIKAIIFKCKDGHELKEMIRKNSLLISFHAVYDDKEAVLALMKLDKFDKARCFRTFVSPRLQQDKDIRKLAGKDEPTGSGFNVSQLGEE